MQSGRGEEYYTYSSGLSICKIIVSLSREGGVSLDEGG
jgi:hypothetical protein